jgi:hypothetical protein
MTITLFYSGVALSIDSHCFSTRYLVRNMKRVKCKRKVTDRQSCDVNTKPTPVATQSKVRAVLARINAVMAGPTPACGIEVYSYSCCAEIFKALRYMILHRRNPTILHDL